MKLHLVIFACFAQTLVFHAAEPKPNIILIYSDDHGYADLGVQGSVTDIRTPDLDALARDGVRFKHGYVSAPQCVPSRAGVLTGRYQQRFGVEDNNKDPLPLEEVTIAERLKPAGYVSCQIGKWHLEALPERVGGKRESAGAIKAGQSYQPWAQGFEEYYTGQMNTFAASLNLPLIGEKGMLTDGGIRTPFLAAWPGKIAGGQVFESPVINLDVAATATALAGLPHDGALDGVNLMPFLLGQKTGKPHDELFWRWRSQAAVRSDHWKLILLGRDERYLFDLDSPEGETKNRITDFPDIAAELDKKLMAWNATLPPPGLPREIVGEDQNFYDAHVNKTGTIVEKQPRKERGATTAEPPKNWVVRNASAEVKEGALHVVGEAGDKQQPFVAFTKLNVTGPAKTKVTLRSTKGGIGGFSWRTDGQKDFTNDQTVSFQVAASQDWQECQADVPANGQIIHLRLLLSAGATAIRQVELLGKGTTTAPWHFDEIKTP